MTLPRIKKKKLFWITVSVFVFVVGLVAGSFLVLRSETSEGALFDPPEIQASSFLDDLKKFQEQNPATPDGGENNLTAKFLLAIAQAGTEQNLAAEDYSDPEFLAATVMPHLENLNFSVFPEIPETDVRVSAKVDEAVYFENVKKYLLLIVGAWQKVLKADANITAAEAEEYKNVVIVLELINQELRAADVPLKYRSTHGRLIQLNAAVKSVLEDGFLKRQDDPIRSLLVINQLDAIVEFAQELLFDVDSLGQTP